MELATSTLHRPPVSGFASGRRSSRAACIALDWRLWGALDEPSSDEVTFENSSWRPPAKPREVVSVELAPGARVWQHEDLREPVQRTVSGRQPTPSGMACELVDAVDAHCRLQVESKPPSSSNTRTGDRLGCAHR
jgi:hypothetical protein